MSVKNWLQFCALGLIWGSSFLWIKIAIQSVGPFTLVTFRVFFALLGLLIVLAIRRPTLPQLKKWWPVFAFMGFSNVAFPFVLISWSEQYISSGMAAILNSTVPLFTIVLSPLFLSEEHYSAARVGGMLMGFFGVVVLVSNQLGGGWSEHLTGQITMLLAAISYSFAAIFARKRTAGLTPEVQALGQMGAASLFITPAALLVEAPFSLPSHPITWVALAWLGLLGSAAATLLFYALIHAIGPTRTTLTSFIFPLVGVILGLVFLGEKMDWRLLAGGALIISGIIVVNRRPRELQTS